MPIVSISKIQHRYGLQENLPQLSAAELGWAIDKRRLFIGNGPTSEGSPAIGNTEILTQHSNLLQVAVNSYSYKDEAIGFEAITGPSLSSPTTRSLQAKLDDFANVRDYGATGDGVTDDTVAITRALTDLYTRDSNTAIRRTLYFPAGVYRVSSTIKIPPYATLQGEGKNCTIITAINDTVTCVARLCDSKLQIGATVGSNGATLPGYVVINDMTFNGNALGIDIFLINSGKYVSFNRVGFTGGLSESPVSAGSQASAMQIFSSAVNHSSNISFNECDFQGINYAVIVDDDMENIVFDKCSFKQLFLGMKIGEDTAGTGASVLGPVGLRITNSLFDRIYAQGIVNYKTARVTSAFNTFLDVGNQRAENPTYANIVFAGNGSSSVCDVFARTDAENLISPRINYSTFKTLVLDSLHGIQVGKRSIEPGGVITLADNTLAPLSTGITFSTGLKSQRINYIASRGNGIRNGYVEITATASGISVSDNFTENGTDIGLTLTATVSGSTVTLRYQTTNTGSSISFSYSVDRNLI